MSLVRSVGRVALTALTVNVIVGSGIFGIPSEITRLVGKASPLAMLVAGLAMAGIMVCFLEVSSRFPQHGGPYLYVTRAFGRYPGVLTGWMALLSGLASSAAAANLFLIYASAFVPRLASGVPRAIVLATLILIPVIANYLGIKRGSGLSVAFTVAKLSPLFLLVGFGIARFSSHPEMLPGSEVVAVAWSHWFEALLLLVFAYGGFEDAIVAMGEVKDPRRNGPISMGTAFLIVIGLYTSLQFVTVATMGTAPVERPLAALGGVLIGPAGATFITVAAMLSTYGYVTGVAITMPRLMYSLAENGDFPPALRYIHPRFKTPSRAIVLYGTVVSLLAITGTFRWALGLTAATMILVYAGVCAALLKLRATAGAPEAIRFRFSPAFAVYGIVLCIALLTRLSWQDWGLLSVTAVLATLNWLWSRRRDKAASSLPIAA